VGLLRYRPLQGAKQQQQQQQQQQWSYSIAGTIKAQATRMGFLQRTSHCLLCQQSLCDVCQVALAAALPQQLLHRHCNCCADTATVLHLQASLLSLQVSLLIACCAACVFAAVAAAAARAHQCSFGATPAGRLSPGMENNTL
jgi:hypothetical protein